MSLVSTGQAGTAAVYSSAAAGSLKLNGCYGQNVGGVWVPNTTGTAVNNPWLTITGLSGMSSANVGQWLTLSGSGHATNNGSWPILSVISSTSCTIANPGGIVDATDLTWSVGYYPYIGPGPVYGAPGVVYGQGENTIPPIDTGSNVGGVWQPSTTAGPASEPSLSYGLTCSADVVQSIRQLLRIWKSAGTYYPNIVIAFDGANGAEGSAFSPNSGVGSGNPDGTFGGVGKLVSGVWVPNRLVASPYDCYCQGTGTRQQCSRENQT
jgi:hypothetical protein